MNYQVIKPGLLKVLNFFLLGVDEFQINVGLQYQPGMWVKGEQNRLTVSLFSHMI